MKSIKKAQWILTVFIGVLIIQSCAKEDTSDDILDDAVVVEEENMLPETNNSDSTDNSEDESTQGNGGITLYAVIEGDLVKIEDYEVSGALKDAQENSAKHEQIWHLVKKLIPSSYLAKINEFEIFWGETAGFLGYVGTTNSDLSTWRMGIAIDDAYLGGFNADGNLAYLIIHELAHIITLDNTQVDASLEEEACQNYFPGEGCAKDNAYINTMYANYWTDIWDAFQKVRDSENGVDNFYEMYNDRFVTAYAASNPAEDIAEVFATFITRDSGANGAKISEQKIQSMYNYPELIDLRAFIKGNTAVAKGKSILPTSSKIISFGTLKHGKCGTEKRKRK